MMLQCLRGEADDFSGISASVLIAWARRDVVLVMLVGGALIAHSIMQISAAGRFLNVRSIH